jgi:hypothetical protein
MMPPLIDPDSPDFTLMRRTVRKTIDASEAIDEPVKSAQIKGSAARAGGNSSGDTSVCQAAGSGEVSGSALGNKVVQIALAEVGTVESPRGSDRGEPCKYQHAGCPQAWCADFASWVYKQAGAPFRGGADGGWRIASSRALADYWKKNGVWIQNPGRPVPVNDVRAPQPGDVVWYPGHQTSSFPTTERRSKRSAATNPRPLRSAAAGTSSRKPTDGGAQSKLMLNLFTPRNLLIAAAVGVSLLLLFSPVCACATRRVTPKPRPTALPSRNGQAGGLAKIRLGLTR